VTTTDISLLQSAKKTIRQYCEAFDKAEPERLQETLEQFASNNYQWRGVHPFHEQANAKNVVDTFWLPLRKAVSSLQRRPDVFLAGFNSDKLDTAEKSRSSIWTCQMGHFMGLFDKPWLQIPPTGRMVFIRFAEFHKVHNDKIVESALFVDLIGLMRQAGQYPLPPQTGASFIYPGPQTHDGLLYETQDAEQGERTLQLIEQMIEELGQANQIAAETGVNRVPREVLAKSWSEDMLWYGPARNLTGMLHELPRATMAASSVGQI